MSDVVLRKQKNARAQAAFRARRTNYIATLEETVTSLESVVIQLQESCRDARAELTDLRHQNAQLRDRDRIWRSLCHPRDEHPAYSAHSHPPPSFAPPPFDPSADKFPPFQRWLQGAAEEQKPPLGSVLDNNAPYVFPNGDRFHHSAPADSVPHSRPMSPTTQSTPSSSTSMSLTSSFPYTFHEQQERSEFDYRPSCPMTLHGGTADISLTAQSDAVRYRMGDCKQDPPPPPDYPPVLAPHENPISHDHQGNQSFNNDPRFLTRRNTMPSHSRSPSPGPPSISCTVAVIKAQAYGALRRTRAKTKKTGEAAAKVAIEVLEARGIGIGASAGHKRQRMDDDDDDINSGTP